MRRLLALVLVLAAVPACTSGTGSPAAGTNPSAPDLAASTLTIHTSGGTVTLRVEIADTPAERARGLMGRRSLPADAGMAFVWDRPVRERFWMKDTLIPLAVAFWDGSGRIVAIREMQPCGADPCPTYDAGQTYVGAVEANRGFFAEHGVAVGDRVDLVMADA